jgi:predicted AAA+ superfamily ATPase
LAELEGTVVIDEVQRRPELFPLLRVLADRPETPARFLILGSASPPCCGNRRNR